MRKIKEYLKRIAEALEQIDDSWKESNEKGSQPDPPGT